MNRFLLATLFGLASMAAYAGPASTFSADVDGSIGFIVTNDDDPNSETSCVLSSTLTVPGSKKDLLIGASIESSIMTETTVKGKKGDTDMSTADGSVDITVKVDGVALAPSPVTFNYREQQLEATLGGVLESCTFGCVGDINPTCTFTKDNCIWTDEEIRLMLSTTTANHFNFVAPNVGNGEHTIEVCATVGASTALGGSGNGSAESWAAVNLGTLTVEVVRSANTDTGITVD